VSQPQDVQRLRRLALAIQQLKKLKDVDLLEKDLATFLRVAWAQIDPAPFVAGWHLDAIAEHLQAVTRGEILRLVINVPPRTSKSTVTSVAWPAWTWLQSSIGALSGPQVQFLYASHNRDLSVRDSIKTRRLIESEWYQYLFGDRFKLVGDQNTKIKFENDKGGYRIATSVGSGLTGSGAMVFAIDDPHDAMERNPDVIQNAADWWDQSASTRLNDAKTGAYVLIMQRLFEHDLTGHILEKERGWTHLMLPMQYDSSRHCTTGIGWEDPRTIDGELLCEERFDRDAVYSLQAKLGSFGTAGQLQQRPEPKGGGIIKSHLWRVWESETGKFPRCSMIIASLDPAYTEKQENDPSGFTIWGLFNDDDGYPGLCLMEAWRKRLQLHGDPIPRYPDESYGEYAARVKRLTELQVRVDRVPGERIDDYERRAMKELTRAQWGLVEWVGHSCKRFNVDRLLIEAKASGISVFQEMMRTYKRAAWMTELVDPKGKDKVSRAWAVQPIFENGTIWAPDKDFATMVIDECSSFPKGKTDDLVDSCTQVLSYFRDNGFLEFRVEREETQKEERMHRSVVAPLYDV
jgi:predicted phage terminase large subunit-like protein